MSSIREVIDTKIFTESRPKIISDKISVLTTDNIGTVIPKSALSNISLTSVPYVIQDAINQAKLDAKDLALADGILTDIKNRLATVEDGMSTRVYVDNKISYLEELLSQKASPEIVAQIADARVAIATENLAATSTVNALTSRVESSESQIINLSETINTKDTARATQINQVEASINQVLASYSEAIELTVDENGNAISQKIENLSLDSADVEEAKTLAQNADGKWTANSSLIIIDNETNKITGFNISASNLSSMFKINAGKFVISDDTDEYTPFIIDSTNKEILLNAKVSFTNTTDVPDFALTTDIKSENTTENGVTYIPNPIGGTYSDVGTKTGALVITLPNSWTDTMMTLEVEVYNYGMDKSFMLKLAGYNYPDRWINTSSNLVGSGLLGFNVRFGHDGTKCCIVIGEITSIWSYPKVKIKNCTFGYSNYAVDTWDDGWNVGLSTDLTGYVFTQTHTSSWQQEVQRAIDNDATYIDGGKIVTNTALVNNLNVLGGIVASNIKADRILTNDITGNTITGSYLEGVIIRNSWIDPTSVGTLTLWAVATGITVSSSPYYSYRANFAFDNDGSLIVDSNGKYRLAGISTSIPYSGLGYDLYRTYVLGGITRTAGINYDYAASNINKGVKLPTYNLYKHNTPARPLAINPTMTIEDMTKNTGSIKNLVTTRMSGGWSSPIESAGLGPAIGDFCKYGFYFCDTLYAIETYQSGTNQTKCRVYNSAGTMVLDKLLYYGNTSESPYIYTISTKTDISLKIKFECYFTSDDNEAGTSTWNVRTTLFLQGTSSSTSETLNIGNITNSSGDYFKFFILDSVNVNVYDSNRNTRITSYDLAGSLQ
jgi:hypothetical protein